MAIVYVGSVSAGTADGSSRANKMAWTSLDAAIVAAAAGSSPFEVRLIAEDTYSAPSATIATLTHGGTLSDPVRIRGWNAAGQLAYVTFTSSRSNPYLPPAPGNDDFWAPATSVGNAGVILFNVDTGASNLVWEYIAVQNIQELLKIRGVVTMVSGQDIKLRNSRRLVEVVSGTGALAGASKTNRCVWQRIDARGFSKQLFQLFTSSHITLDQIYADSQGQGYDGISTGGSTAGSTAPLACTDIIFSRMTVKNCINYLSANTPYRFSIGGGATGGTFTLSYNGATTAAIAWNATKATIKTALALIGGLNAANIFTTGAELSAAGTPVFSFGWGMLVAGPATPVTLDATGLTGGTYTLTQVQAWAAMATAYVQGDGISTEEFDSGILVENCTFVGNGDGGTDMKSSASIVRRCTATDCKRNFRSHPGNTDFGLIVEHCVSKDPYLRPYPSGHPLNGIATPTGAQAHFSSNGSLHVIEPHAIDTDATKGANTVVFELADSGANIAVYGGVIARKTGSSMSVPVTGSVFTQTGAVSDTVT